MNSHIKESANQKVDISIVIVSFNTRDMTRKCLKCVEKYAGSIAHEVFVVDNASADGSADMISKEFPWVHLIRLSENRGFAGGNIPAMKRAAGRYILLLNSDAFLSEEVVAKTLLYMDQNPHVGILGCKLTDPDGGLQPSARMLPNPLNKILHITGLAAHFPKSKFFGRVDFSWWDHSEPRIVGWVVGAFFLIRKEMMAEIGALDDRYFLYFEEIDYCLSAKRAGWDVVFYPYVSVIHLGGQSAAKTGEKLSSKGKQMISVRMTSEFRYYRKLYGCFHVFLSATIEFFWNLIVYARNLFRRSDYGTARRKDAMIIMGLIVSTLLKDRWGKGRR